MKKFSATKLKWCFRGAALVAIATIVAGCVGISGFAYVLNEGSNSLSIYKIDSDTGALLSMGPEIPTGPTPESLTVTPDGNFIVIGNSRAPTYLATYALNLVSGALNQASSIPLSSTTFSVQMHQGGNFLYSMGSGDGIASYKVDPTNGKLTALAMTPLVSPPHGVLGIDVSGDYAYAVNAGSIAVFGINTATGGLNLVSKTPSENNSPTSIALNPARHFAYVTDHERSLIRIYDTNPIFFTRGATQVLAPVGQPMPIAFRPTSIVIDRSGRYAYVLGEDYAKYGSAAIFSYAINQDSGALTAVGQPVQMDNVPRSIAIDASSRFVYAANTVRNTISTYKVDQSTGGLSATGVTVPTGRNPTKIVLY